MIWIALLLGCSEDPALAEATIGPLGGSVSVDEVTLTIPEGALLESHRVRIVDTEILPEDHGARHIYAFEPSDLELHRAGWVAFEAQGFEQPQILWRLVGESSERFEVLETEIAGRTAVAPINALTEGFVWDAAMTSTDTDDDTDL